MRLNRGQALVLVRLHRTLEKQILEQPIELLNALHALHRAAGISIDEIAVAIEEDDVTVMRWLMNMDIPTQFDGVHYTRCISKFIEQKLKESENQVN